MKKIFFKKLLCVFLSLAVFVNIAGAYGNVDYEEFDEYKSKFTILYGLILVVGGGILAYDGFRTVKTDISRPQVTMNYSGWWYKNEPVFQYELHSSGNMTNTGNVDLRNVEVLVAYLDAALHLTPNSLGVPVDFTTPEATTRLSNFAVGENATWSNNSQYSTTFPNSPRMQGSDRPDIPEKTGGEDVEYEGNYPESIPSDLVKIVGVSYDYDKKYKKEMHNIYEGIGGLLLFAGGAYLLIDYIVGLKRFDYYLKKNNMNIYVANDAEEFKLMVSKKI